MIQRYIERGQITGAITMVSRRGKVAHFEAQGQMDLEAKTPMRKDAIFRIASMSKPITGVAILMLMEEGKLRLTDPVSRFIPEFKDTKVAIVKTPGARRAAATGSRRATRRSTRCPPSATITIRDLLTHTSGLESGGAGTRAGARMAPRSTSEQPREVRADARRRCRSTSSRARSGATARSPASKRSAASSKSRRA